MSGSNGSGNGRGVRGRRRWILARVMLALVAAATALAGCGASGGGAGSGTSSSTMPDDAVVIDVRTPAEFESGHLRGARNINLASGDFVEVIAALPVDVPYVVYCRTGNRSAQAVEIMRSTGFADVTDAGGLDDAQVSTGLPIESSSPTPPG